MRKLHLWHKQCQDPNKIIMQISACFARFYVRF